jgi:hypothetical protein
MDFDPNIFSSIIPSMLLGQLIIVNGIVFAIMARFHKLIPLNDRWDPLIAGAIAALLNVLVSMGGNHLYVYSIIYGFLFGVLTTNSNHADPEQIERTTENRVMRKISDRLDVPPPSIPHTKQKQ